MTAQYQYHPNMQIRWDYQNPKWNLSKKNTAKQRWQTHRRLEDKRTYTRLQKQAQTVLPQHKEAFWERSIEVVSEDLRKFWKLQRALGMRRCPNAPINHQDQLIFSAD